MQEEGAESTSGAEARRQQQKQTTDDTEHRRHEQGCRNRNMNRIKVAQQAGIRRNKMLSLVRFIKLRCDEVRCKMLHFLIGAVFVFSGFRILDQYIDCPSQAHQGKVEEGSMLSILVLKYTQWRMNRIKVAQQAGMRRNKMLSLIRFMKKISENKIFRLWVQFLINFTFFSLCFRTLDQYMNCPSQAHQGGVGEGSMLSTLVLEYTSVQ